MWKAFFSVFIVSCGVSANVAMAYGGIWGKNSFIYLLELRVRYGSRCATFSSLPLSCWHVLWRVNAMFPDQIQCRSCLSLQPMFLYVCFKKKAVCLRNKKKMFLQLEFVLICQKTKGLAKYVFMWMLFVLLSWYSTVYQYLPHLCCPSQIHHSTFKIQMRGSWGDFFSLPKPWGEMSCSFPGRILPRVIGHYTFFI